MQEKREYAKIRLMAQVSLAAALAIVLSPLKIFQMPQGGSVSLEMVPIFFIAIRFGGVWGMVAGLIAGIGQVIFGAYIVHPVQFILDYPLAFALLGVAGFMKNLPLVGVLAGSALRFLAHVVSGAVFFGQYAPEKMNVWFYSAIYNASYMLPETVITLVAIVSLLHAERVVSEKKKKK